MILTADEYSRGFVILDAVVPDGCSVSLWTGTADQPHDVPQWTGPHSALTGSKVLSPPQPYPFLRLELIKGENQTESPIVKKVRWERDGQTFVWSEGQEGFDSPPRRLSLGRDYGYSYRLVLRPRKAVWLQPLVAIDRSVRIRFCKQQLKSSSLIPVSDSEHAAAKAALGGSKDGVTWRFIEDTAEGDLVEVLATVPSDDKEQGLEAAESWVESVVGLLALCVGEQILGERLFENYYFSNATSEEILLPPPVKHLSEVSFNTELAAFLDDSLGTFCRSPLASSIQVALRWYAKGLSSATRLDAFIAYFIGLEALSGGYFQSLQPRPERKQYAQTQEYLAKAQPPIDHRLRQVLLARMADFPLTAKFHSYWADRFGKKTRQSSEFDSFCRLRSEVLHGSRRLVTRHEANAARILLERLLARELEIQGIIESRQSAAPILELWLHFKPKNP